MRVGIAEVHWRQHVEIEGTIELIRVRSLAHNSAMLEIIIADQFAEVTAVFFGFRQIGGMKLGRRLSVEGMVVNWNGKLAFLNPCYTLFPT